MRTTSSICITCLAVGASAFALRSASPAEQSTDKSFTELVQPFLKTYCLGCHGATKQEGKLDLSGFTSVAAVVKSHAIWDTVRERLEAEEMPPEKAKGKPSAKERQAVLDWIKQFQEHEARRNAGDPGLVLARRLSNAEYDYTILDLTGVDIKPTREFPVDPANEAGFDNSGESLTMSPALLKKYIAAARQVADHVVLKPDGIVFASHPAVTDTDRDKYCVQRIISFYDRHKVDYADYFQAAWSYRQREAKGKPNAKLDDFARQAKLSPKYLATVWSVLHDAASKTGPIHELQAKWQDLSKEINQAEARRGCERLRDLVLKLRKEFPPTVKKLQVKGISDGTQSFMLWRNQQLASQHMKYMGDPKAEDAADRERFCRVFPDAFTVTERAPYYDPGSSSKGRLLSAGFHLMFGYFRDDEPLCTLVLDDAERKEIDRLWEELHFITQDAARQYKDFIFFERAEPPRFMQEPAFDFARSEDKDATSAAKLQQAREVYLAKARKIGASAEALEAIETYFSDISAAIRKTEKDRLAAESIHLAALQDFAARAYRRPLTAEEKQDILGFYRRLRDQDQLGHEDAFRDTLASVLMSPNFCYRFDLAGRGPKIQPLSDHALASRLSYFLWSRMPDAELLRHAAAGDLHKPEVLVAQARRLLKDGKIRGLAEQFAGNWLEFRRFEETNTVDRDRFPAFTNELRQAMSEEPVRFFTHVVQENQPMLDFLTADYTFVNSALAKHYGVSISSKNPDEWVKVEDAGRYERGGLLPMGIFLTKNAPGLRTSPVKRGYWVVRRLLGEHIPPPPPEVPELPKDEAKFGELTLPQLLARHRDHKACAGCHQRFDSLGLAFEAFGPIGERRTKDLGGRPIETKAVYPDGRERTGVEGLRGYLIERRQEEFVDNLCRKLLAYALGRSLVLSDKPTLEAMRKTLAKDGYRMGSLVEAIVTSPQFLNRRGQEAE